METSEFIQAVGRATVMSISYERINKLFARQALQRKIKSQNSLMGQSSANRYVTFIQLQSDIAARVKSG
jgi:hypothetical protein